MSCSLAHRQMTRRAAILNLNDLWMGYRPSCHVVCLGIRHCYSISEPIDTRKPRAWLGDVRAMGCSRLMGGVYEAWVCPAGEVGRCIRASFWGSKQDPLC